MNLEKRAQIHFIISMLIFGTIGLFVKFIPLSAGIIASSRGILGGLFICILLLTKKDKISIISIKENFKMLLLSGFLIASNWIFLFEGFKYSTVSAVTVLYYLCPIFLLIWSAVFFKEKISIKQVICIVIALIGVVLISGLLNGDGKSLNQIKGIVYGILAGVFYSLVILCNNKLKHVKQPESTMIQIFIAGLFVLPHALFTTKVINISMNMYSVFMLLIVVIVHTGIAYVMYFDAVSKLKTGTVAILSYLDPVFALMMAVLFLKEKMGIIEIIGALLILSSAYISEKNKN